MYVLRRVYLWVRPCARCNYNRSRVIPRAVLRSTYRFSDGDFFFFPFRLTANYCCYYWSRSASPSPYSYRYNYRRARADERGARKKRTRLRKKKKNVFTIKTPLLARRRYIRGRNRDRAQRLLNTANLFEQPSVCSVGSFGYCSIPYCIVM